MMSLTPLESALELRAVGDEYIATVPDEWSFNGRVFGGFLAALAARAAGIGAPDLSLSGFQAVFPAAARPGQITCTVRLLRRGSNSAVLYTELLQGDRLVLSGHCWFLAEKYFGLDPATERPTSPLESPPVEWISEAVPFLGHFSSRAVDFPVTPDGLGDGSPQCVLWLQSKSALTGLENAGCLIDLLVFDTFLLECVFRSEGAFVVEPVSLDLQARWLDVEEPDAWRKIATRAVMTDSLSVTEGALYSESGRMYATANCHGRIYRPG